MFWHVFICYLLEQMDKLALETQKVEVALASFNF